MFIDSYYFSVSIKDCLLLKFEHATYRTTITTKCFVYKSQQIEYFFFSFVFKVMEYPEAHTQKFNVNKEKNDFLCHPFPFWRGGGGCCNNPPPLPLMSGTTPLDENF